MSVEESCAECVEYAKANVNLRNALNAPSENAAIIRPMDNMMTGLLSVASVHV